MRDSSFNFFARVSLPSHPLKTLGPARNSAWHNGTLKINPATSLHLKGTRAGQSVVVSTEIQTLAMKNYGIKVA